jgi:APA family basic amino acid/polyamine antiporter
MSNQNTKLIKSFGLNMAIVLVVSNIIGSGVFKKVAPMSQGLLSPDLVIWAWVLAGLVTLFGVLTVAEAGTMFPHSGGAYSWLEKMYGKTISFFYGWSCFTVIQTAAIASIAYVFAGALGNFVEFRELDESLTSIHFGPIAPFKNIMGKVVASSLILLLTIVNVSGAKNGGRLSQIFTWIVVICIVFIIAVGLSSAIGSTTNLTTPSSKYPSPAFSNYAGFGIVMAMVIAMRNAFWGYEGWISLGYVGGEIQNPGKNVPRALIIGIFIVIIAYVLLNISYLYVMPIDTLLEKVNANENNIAAVVVMNEIFGKGGGYIISALILISTFGCTNTTILTASRIYYAMAKKGLFFKKAAELHPKNKTPSKSLIYQSIWACILVFSGSFDTLTDLLIFAAFIFYGMVVFGVIVLRFKMKDTPRPYKTIGYPVVPILFVIFCIMLVVISIIETPIDSLIGLGLIFSGLPFYLAWKKRSDAIPPSQEED